MPEDKPKSVLIDRFIPPAALVVSLVCLSSASFFIVFSLVIGDLTRRDIEISLEWAMVGAAILVMRTVLVRVRHRSRRPGK